MRRGCLIAVAVFLGLAGAAAALLGPPVLRRARAAWAPIAEMKSEQEGFEAWEAAQGWREPDRPRPSAERLDAFLALRRELGELERRQDRLGRPPGGKPGLQDVLGAMREVSGLMSDRHAAFRRHGMTPAEYGYLEHLVYRRWRPALAAAGEDPAARERAAAEIDQASRREPTAVRARLGEIAAGLRAHVPPAPEGIPEEVHRLLLERAAAIEAQPAGSVDPMARRGRGRGRRSPPPAAGR